jgi:hypothetical protein
MQGDSNGIAWVQAGEGPMRDQAAARAEAAEGAGEGGGGIMTDEARAKLSGRS